MYGNVDMQVSRRMIRAMNSHYALIKVVTIGWLVARRVIPCAVRF